MRLISWNVNGIRAILTKGFEDFFNKIDADIFCIQETKCQKGQVDLKFEGYRSYWNSAEKKGYSGTAIFTKIDEKLKALEENNNNSNINVLRSELEILENEFKNMTSGESSILSAMDLLSKSNRAGLGI